MECGLTRFSDGIKFGGTIDNPVGTQLPRLHRLEGWASRYLVKFNKKKQVLQLGRRDPPPEQYGLWMAFLAGEEICINALGW